MRIASLVPSATEMLFELGVGESVVAVTHECDHPDAATRLPHLTRSLIPAGLSTAQIDGAVRERTERGEALYELDAELLERLRPDLVVTQALCAVCAVSVDDVRALAARAPSRPRVMSLDPSTLAEVLDDLPALAAAVGVPEAGTELRRRSLERLERVRRAVAGAPRPRVVALEWLDPPFVAGHWVPEMIGLAGGVDPLGRPGQRSGTASWEQIAQSAADVVVAMPCGYDAERSARETLDHRRRVGALGAGRVVAVDASAYFSRPGPRLVEGVELLGHLLHPGRVPPAPPGRALDLASALAAPEDELHDERTAASA